MQSNAQTVDEYIIRIPDHQRDSIVKLREVILSNIPPGFAEVMSYGMIGYVVPHSIYPNGYHCNPKLPLPFINIAAQKNFIAVYHMGIYSSPSLLEWFINEYSKYTSTKPDMGKGCIRFKNYNEIPYKLIGELVTKIDVAHWISQYEMNRDIQKKK